MRIRENYNILQLLLCSLLFSGFAVDAVPYDWSFTPECLAHPEKPQYNGGIVVNPELDHGLNGWAAFGGAVIEQRVSNGGNNTFIVAHHRNQPYDSFSQPFYLEAGLHYAFSAWLQVSRGNAEIAAVFKTSYGFEYAGWRVVGYGCWSLLLGGVVVDVSGTASLYFESDNPLVDIWADNISLQPFTKQEWTSHQQQSVDKARKSSVKIVAVDGKGAPLANATVSVKQTRPHFPLGCAISKYIITNPGYQKWFASRFKVTAFENEMKWVETEATRGKEDYSRPDAMLEFAKKNGIAVRGHNVYWEDPKYQPQWLNSLSPKDFNAAVAKRALSVVGRYKGKLISWDAVNENLHHDYFETKLGLNASAFLFNKVHEVEEAIPLFLNEYNTIEQPSDKTAAPDKYLVKIAQMQAAGSTYGGGPDLAQGVLQSGYRGPMGVGLQGHFSNKINIAYMRAAITQLAHANLPIWLTEVDISRNLNQSESLELVLREAHSHPNVDGIILWSGWRPEGCSQMCLTDKNFKNLPTGDVVDKLIKEWGGRGFSGTTDSDGNIETMLYHGDYEVTVTDHPHHDQHAKGPPSMTQNFKVQAQQSKTVLLLHVKVDQV